MLTIKSNPPSDSTAADIATFQSLILEGGEVDARGLSQRVAHAERLAFALDDHNLLGIGALKLPNFRYRKSIFAKSGSSRLPTDFSLELGWVYVKHGFRGRGISLRLVQELLATAHGSNVFATARTNNTAMHRSLERSGFVRDGKPYASEMRNDKLQLFVRVGTELAAAASASQAARR